MHHAEVLNTRPHIVFPGNLQGRHVRETGAKGASLVTVENGEITDLVNVHSDVVRWAAVTVDLRNTTSFDEVLDRIRDAIENAVANFAGGRLLACRILLRGRTEFHEQLLADGDPLLSEARSIALGLGEETAWVEKVVVETEPVISPETMEQREDAVGDLLRMLQGAGSDADLLSRLETDIGGMVRRLPPEVRSAVEDTVLRAAIDRDHSALIAGVTPFLSARLLGGQD